MHFPTRAKGLLASFALVAALTGCAATSTAAETPETPDKLVFAQIPSESAQGIAENNAAIIAAIEETTGIEVEIQQVTDYAAVIEGLRAGQIQLAALGPFSYMVAKDSGAGVEALGALVDDPDQEPGYKSYGIVPAGSDITDLAGFAGKTVCFVDPTSTSGFLYPSAGLLDLDIDPETGVTPVFAGGHDASALSVADGTCDAGFAYDTMVTTQIIESGSLKEGDLEVVWESETIAGSPYVASDTLPADLIEQLQDIFATDLNIPALVESGICSSAADCQLPEESEYGFIPVEDSLYDGVRAVCATTKAAACNV
ncbi:phosphate/phosphite/phosphonate ABC transporter substrate-binding protein [Cryobacterium frigoriphilum]|uniref:Phosphate/phosphite/phosphonate ABC transporter substrate-binding protein n=1 Tax=Cryobacterium frigoriphilum TaxID=1259150 RepID=A0A4R8ZUG4_9MICO|nr:phosphate/phosphite/phosphonate ABC transporter substrate-binding protein [Cryobacterium frigoriphilum]TFD45956.1 phosphate/phosphite/phosphonate ABC transporter substrate-binding protein [Cryobacterium frigoriphilum]